eukprot:6195593-Pleurochrysis_carterae.AAC.3
MPFVASRQPCMGALSTMHGSGGEARAHGAEQAARVVGDDGRVGEGEEAEGPAGLRHARRDGARHAPAAVTR